MSGALNHSDHVPYGCAALKRSRAVRGRPLELASRPAGLVPCGHVHVVPCGAKYTASAKIKETSANYGQLGQLPVIVISTVHVHVHVYGTGATGASYRGQPAERPASRAAVLPGWLVCVKLRLALAGTTYQGLPTET